MASEKLKPGLIAALKSPCANAVTPIHTHMAAANKNETIFFIPVKPPFYKKIYTFIRRGVSASLV
jgi:hypothetical protein